MNIKVITLLISFLFFFFSNAYSQEYYSLANSNSFQELQYFFHHDIHNEKAEIEECNVCHHLYDEEKNILKNQSSEDLPCSSCHLTSTKFGLRRAFHLTCKTCHKERKKGPLLCGYCHSNIEQ